MLDELAESFFVKLTDVNSRQEGIEKLKQFFGKVHMGGNRLSGLWYQCMPKGLELSNRETDRITRTWTEVYDLLCLDALYRVGQMVERHDPPVSTVDLEDEEDDDAADDLRISAPVWLTGDPERDGRYLCQVLIGPDETKHEQKMEWKEESWRVFGDLAEKYQITVTGWWPLPEGRV